MLENGKWLPWIFALLGAAVIMLLIVIVVKCFLAMRKWRKQEESPVTVVRATVLVKEERLRTHRKLGVSSFDVEVEEGFFITFGLENGESKILEVPEELFRAFAESDNGSLHYQGNRFLQFERE